MILLVIEKRDFNIERNSTTMCTEHDIITIMLLHWSTVLVYFRVHSSTSHFVMYRNVLLIFNDIH